VTPSFPLKIIRACRGTAPGRPLAALGAVLVLSLLAAACSSGASTSSGTHKAAASGGTVTYAEDPDAPPNWIMPIVTPSHLQAYNTSNVALLYPTLYAYSQQGSSITLNAAQSPAYPPVYTNGDKTLTITLKPWVWSNGQPLTSRDVQFWYNLVKVSKSQWGNYAIGDIPDNVTSFSIVNSSTFRMTLTKAFNPSWYTANQLTLINLMPQASWDKTSATGAVGNYDLTPSGAKAVFSFLLQQANDVATYASNPMWQVVAGPFKLQSWTNTGQVTFVPNRRYSGADKARIKLVEVPFTSEEAELLALRSGTIDYGYVPASDLPQKSSIEQEGYSVEPWWGWEITYLQYNYNNPQAGPLFAQLYIRQAMQYAIDQPAISASVWDSAAVPDYGPIPVLPKSQYLSSGETDNPYPYDPAKSAALLRGHGWTTVSGVATCTSPGSGATQCGAGIAKGTKLSFRMLSESGSPETSSQDAYLKSAFSKVGIQLAVQEEPLDSVLGATIPCTASQDVCNWQISYFGTQGSWNFPAFPSGDQPFLTGSEGNLGSYDSSTADSLIEQTLTSSSMSAVYAYEAYMAQNLPVGWLPNPAFQISAISTKLGGVSQNPLLYFTPQQWYLAN
jgi:peptide/nickel transport system substrate-binding protein